MKNNNDINYIYEKLSSLYPHYSNKKPKAKIYSKAYTSLIGVMLSAQSQDKRTAVACKQLFALADSHICVLLVVVYQLFELRVGDLLLLVLLVCKSDLLSFLNFVPHAVVWHGMER